MSALHRSHARRLAVELLLSPAMLLGAGYAVGASASPDGAELTGVAGTQSSQIDRFRAYPWFERAYRLQRQGDVHQAIAAMEQGLARQPGALRERLAYADLLTAAGRRSDALVELDRLLEATPDLLPARRRRAVLRGETGQIAAARADYEAILAHHETSHEEKAHARSALVHLPVQESSAVAGASVVSIAAEAPRPVPPAQGAATEGTAVVGRGGSEQKAAQSASPRTVSLAERAHLAFQQGRHDEAARRFELLADRARNSPEVRAKMLLSLGYAHEAAGRIAASVAAFEEAARVLPRREHLEALAVAAAAAGDLERELQALAQISTQAPELRNQLRYVDALARAGRTEEAAQQYRGIAAATLDRDPGQAVTLLERETRLRLEQGDVPGALRSLQELAALNGVPREARQKALFEMAMLHEARAEHGLALQCLEELFRSGDVSTRVLAALGHARLRASRLHEALEMFETLWQRESQASHALASARVLWSLGQAPQAIERAEQALALQQGLEAEEQLQVLEELGYMHATEGDAARAETLWRAALGSRPSAQIVVHLAALQWRLNKQDEALATLATHRARDPADVALMEDKRAELLESKGRVTQAYQALARAEVAVPSKQRRRRIALLAHQMQKVEAAGLLESAIEEEADVSLLMAMGYVYEKDGRLVDAASAFERAVSLSPDNLEALRALGYAQLRIGRREDAVRNFRLAIDRLEDMKSRSEGDERGQKAQRPTPVQEVSLGTAGAHEPQVRRRIGTSAPVWLAAAGTAAPGSMALSALERSAGFQAPPVEEDDDTLPSAAVLAQTTREEGNNMPVGTPADRERDLRQLRSQMRTLNDHFDVIVSQTYRHKSSTQQTSVPFITPAAATPSQGGLQVGWRPGGTPLPGEREWQLYGRTVWGNREESLEIDSDTVQGAVGLRLQLVPGLQIYAAAERTIRIGDNTDSDNVLRLTAGWSDGFERPVEHPFHWNYTTLYADVGRHFKQDQTAAYVEARQGRSFAIGGRWSLTPYLVAVAAQLSHDPSNLSYSELGAGLSLRTQFGGNRYESHAGTFDIVLQYRKGYESSAGGWVASAVVGF